jgi:hypothetical protein
MSITETIPTQTSTMNDFSTNGLSADGFLPNGTPIMPFEEFQKLTIEDKEKYLRQARPQGYKLTMDEFYELSHQERAMYIDTIPDDDDYELTEEDIIQICKGSRYEYKK